MWWNKEIFGLDAYHVILWFLMYCMLGWLIESIYMSICNKKLTNRGFMRGPYCPIYGVGALTVFFVLKPYSDNGVVLFLLGSLLATLLEIVTAAIMQRTLGSIWWDYKKKPFNYKGIICLESSVAWGFYTLFLFMFLHNFVMWLVNLVPVFVGRTVGTLIIVVLAVDFISALYEEKKEELPEQVAGIRDYIQGKINW